MKHIDLFLFAGEHSGDIHGEALIKELLKINPRLKISGVGGPRMRSAGLECILPMEEFQVMGFIDVLKSLKKLKKHYYFLQNALLKSKPKGIITIDYPGFNLRLIRSLSKKNISSKLIHYICPSVWAWGKGRIKVMEKHLDHLLTILPFEQELFNPHLLKTSFVGHPLIEKVNSHKYDSNWKTTYGIDEKKNIITIFPGSRAHEINKNLSKQLEIAKRLATSYKNLDIIISCADDHLAPLIAQKGANIPIIPQKHLYEVMRATHLAISTSGTVTLELALHHIPTIVTYTINPVDCFIAKNILRINMPYYSLPNIILSNQVFPEFFGPQFTIDNAFEKASEFIISEYKRNNCIELCQSLNGILSNKNAGKESAKIVLESINC